MRVHRILIWCIAALLMSAALPARAVETTALVRFLLASDRYVQMEVEYNDRTILRQQANTVSDYIAVPTSERGGTLVVYGIELGTGKVLVNGYTGFGRPGIGGLLIVRDDGVTTAVPEVVKPVPAGKSALRVITADAPAARPELTWGTQSLPFASGNAESVTHVVSPGTARL